MILAAHQPNYLPNIAFFNKMAQADAFVIFTNAKFSKGDGWVRRHKIKGVNKDQWLTVPVHSHDDDRIRDVHIDNSQHWLHRHRLSIVNAYASTAERGALAQITRIYMTRWERLSDLNVALILEIRSILGITTPVMVDEDVGGEKQHLLINLCVKHGADAYLSGMGGKQYMTEEYFADMRRHGITHYFVENDLTAQYPYTALHYIFTQGLAQVRPIVFLRTLQQTPLLVTASRTP